MEGGGVGRLGLGGWCFGGWVLRGPQGGINSVLGKGEAGKGKE